MTVRRKSLWRSQNSKRARKFSNKRAAKERKRMERLAAPVVMPKIQATPKPRRAKPLFVVTIRCRDGAHERLAIYDLFDRPRPSPTTAAKKIATVLQHYRPATP